MKLIDIAKRIDKSKENEPYIDIVELGEELNVECGYVEQDRVRAYWIGNWYCTDSYVGYRMYFLDDKPVAVSIQQGRKCDETFEWFSKELALKVRDYLISIMLNNTEEFNFKLCDINEDLGDSYKISFNSEILNPERATYNGEPIKILERIKENPDWGIDQQLKIELSDTEQKIIDINEIDFKFNLT